MKYLIKFLFHWFPTLLRSAVVLFMVAVTGLIFVQVWLRYIFHLPLLWVEEIAVIPAVWLYLLAASYGSYERSHIKVDVLDLLIKNKEKRLVSRIIIASITLGIVAVFIWWASQFFIWDLTVKPTSRIFAIPILWGRGSILVAAIIMGLYTLAEVIDYVGQYLRSLRERKLTGI